MQEARKDLAEVLSWNHGDAKRAQIWNTQINQQEEKKCLRQKLPHGPATLPECGSHRSGKRTRAKIRARSPQRVSPELSVPRQEAVPKEAVALWGPLKGLSRLQPTLNLLRVFLEEKSPTYSTTALDITWTISHHPRP